MSPFSDESRKLLDKLGTGEIGAWYPFKLPNRARTNRRTQGKIGHIHGHTVLAQRARDGDNDPRNPAQDKNRTLQKGSLLSV